jgi:transposase-like protein
MPKELNGEQQKINPYKLTREEKKAICEEWKISGQTKQLFCQSHGISEATFYNWYAHYMHKKEETAFSPVKVVDKTATKATELPKETAIEIVLPNSTVIRFNHCTKNISSCIKEVAYAVAALW